MAKKFPTTTTTTTLRRDTYTPPPSPLPLMRGVLHISVLVVLFACGGVFWFGVHPHPHPHPHPHIGHDAQNITPGPAPRNGSAENEAVVPRPTAHPLLQHCVFAVNGSVPEGPAVLGVDGFCVATENFTALAFESLRYVVPSAEGLRREGEVQSIAGVGEEAAELLRRGCAELSEHGIQNERNLSSCGFVHEFGFGAMLTGMVKTLAIALAHDQPFAFKALDSVWSFRGATGRSYFSDVFPCGHGKCIWRNTASTAFHRMQRFCKPSGKRRSCKPRLTPYGTERIYHTLAKRRPPSFTTALPAPFWLNAELLRFTVFPLVPEVRTFLTQLLEYTNLEDLRPTLTLHVRHGDSCPSSDGYDANVKGRECSALADYMPGVNEMLARYSFRSVFVVTDDNEIREGASDLLHGLGVPETVKVVSSPFATESFYDVNGTKVVIERAHDFDSAGLGQRFLAELVAMSYTQGFVGKFTSNVFKNAYLLAATHNAKQCMKPVISLDAPLCHDFGNRRGINCETSVDFMC